MERPLVGGEIADQRPPAVGISDAEVGMAGQRLDHVDRVGALRRGLQREPFVEHQAVVPVAVVKFGEGRLALRPVEAGQHRSARLAGRSYCRRRRYCALASAAPRAGSPAGQQRQRHRSSAGGRPWRAATGRLPARSCAWARASSSASAEPTARRSASRLRWMASGSTSSIRSPIRLSRRQGQCFALERRVERIGAQRAAHRGDDRRGIGRLAARPGDQRAEHQFLERLVAGEGIGIDLGQPLKLARPAARRRAGRARRNRG